GIGALDARLREHGPVEADPGDAVALERGAEPAERLRVPVDDRDRIVPVLEYVGERRSDSTAAHDYDVHDRPPTMSRSLSKGRLATTPAPQRYALTWPSPPPGRRGIFSARRKEPR